jgi:hypothetical protein
MAPDVSEKGHGQSTAMYVSNWHYTASECLYSLWNSQTRHGTARPRSALCNCVLAVNFFLEELLFSHTEGFQFTDFCFWKQLFYKYVSRACKLMYYILRLCHTLYNKRVSVSYGGVINMLWNVDVPETKFLGKYLFRLYRAMCSTAHNGLGSNFHCSKFSIK